MTTAGTRLDTVTGALTARERAILILRPWLAGGTGDDRLRRLAPAEQNAEVERIENAINNYNQHVHSALGFAVEWLWENEVRLAWLECLDGILGQDGGADVLRSVPIPALGFNRSIASVFGKTIGAEEELPTSWPEVREHLLEDLRLALTLRWADCLAFGGVREEARELMGEEMLHIEPRAVLEQISAKISELHDAVERIGGPFELGEPTDEQVEVAQSYLDREALKDSTVVAPRTGRPWMRPEQLAEVEAREAELAAELRARR